MGTGKTLFTVQTLRAIAAACVVVHHVFSMLVHNAGYLFSFPGTGTVGVDLFFLISGFIMVYAQFDDFQTPGASASFVRRRIIRIAPLYWIATTLTVALLVIVPQLFSSISLNWNNVLCSYAFLLSPNSRGDIGTVIQTGWTLCYEFYFYAVFAALLLLPRKHFLIAAGLIFVIGLLVGASGAQLPPWATVATNPLIMEFYLGSIFAFLFLAGFSLPSGLAIVAIVLSIAGILIAGDAVSENWKRLVLWGIPCGIILAGAVSLERIVSVPKILVALGASSYSLYLVHPFVLAAFGKAWSLMHLSAKVPAIIPGLIAFSTALIVAHGVHLWLEKPMTKWLLNVIPHRRRLEKMV
jgi:exopolysaccharide production protein ExoZ